MTQLFRAPLYLTEGYKNNEFVPYVERQTSPLMLTQNLVLTELNLSSESRAGIEPISTTCHVNFNSISTQQMTQCICYGACHPLL